MERRVVRRVSVPSVARVVFALSLAVWGIGFVGLVALYVLGLVSGGLGGVEGFIASLGFTGFRLSILPFLGVYVLAAGLASAVTAVAAAVLAYLYNGLHPIVGGVEFSLEEPRSAGASAPPTQQPALPPSRPPPPASAPAPYQRPAPAPPARPDVPGGVPRPGE